jgi:hypothetical protein
MRSFVVRRLLGSAVDIVGTVVDDRPAHLVCNKSPVIVFAVVGVVGVAGVAGIAGVAGVADVGSSKAKAMVSGSLSAPLAASAGMSLGRIAGTTCDTQADKPFGLPTGSVEQNR